MLHLEKLAEEYVTRYPARKRVASKFVLYEAMRKDLVEHNTAIVKMLENYSEYFLTPEITKDEVPPRYAPLRMYGISHQWTHEYLREVTWDMLIYMFKGILDADLANIDRMFRRSIFHPTNYIFKDRLGDYDDVGYPEFKVRPLANADGWEIPEGPNSEWFDGNTHNHYMGIAKDPWEIDLSTSLQAVNSLLWNVIEHYGLAQMELHINKEEAGYIEKHRPYFFPFMVRENTIKGYRTVLDVIKEPNDNQLEENKIDPNNCAIGVYGQAEVWIKPYVPKGYIVARNMASKLIAVRVPNMIEGQLSLEDNVFSRTTGFAVRDRLAAAILYINPDNKNVYSWSDYVVV